MGGVRVGGRGVQCVMMYCCDRQRGVYVGGVREGGRGVQV